MPIGDPRLQLAIDRFDLANSQDPNQDAVGADVYPKELLYARRMTEQLQQFEPNASGALRLAARCQHIMRWQIPRDQFPKDRAGYHRWRTTLYSFHAEKAGEILRDVGYDDATISRVQSLVRKERLKSDPEMQTLEDVICLVFLEHYLAEFAAEHDEAKVISILRKTWKKMSPRGQDAAPKLQLDPTGQELLKKSLAPSRQDD